MCLHEEGQKYSHRGIEATKPGENLRGVKLSLVEDLQLQDEASKTDLDCRVGALRLFFQHTILFELRTLEAACNEEMRGAMESSGKPEPLREDTPLAMTIMT